jgi:hypothetical protein
MPLDSHRRWQVHDSFNEFRFFQLGHGVKSALEFLASQPVTVLERRNFAWPWFE